MPDGFSDTVQILGSGATPGVLQPGERIRVPVYYAGLLQPWDFSDTSVDFNLTESRPRRHHRRSTGRRCRAGLRPPGISAEAWAPIFANLTAQVGSTWGDLRAHAGDNAQYLGRLGQHVVDVSQLWAFEVQQADRPQPAAEPGRRDRHPGGGAGAADHLRPRLRRQHRSAATNRGRSAGAGPGPTAGSSSLTMEPDGTAVVSGSDGGQRRFEPDSRRPGTYFSQAGDHATLTALGGGVFLLREPDGLVTRFRSDGRVDYVEDPNGNRITATWTGTGSPA